MMSIVHTPILQYYLPDNVSVFPILGVRLVVGDSNILLEVVDSNIAIVQPNHQHVRMLRMKVKTHNAG